MRRLQRFALGALYPRTPSMPGIRDLDLDAFLDRFHREASFAMRAGLVAGSVVFAVAPPLVVGVPLPAFLLSERMLDRYATRMGTHGSYPIRLATLLVKLPGGLHYGSHPKVRTKLDAPVYRRDPGTWRTA